MSVQVLILCSEDCLEESQNVFILLSAHLQCLRHISTSPRLAQLGNVWKKCSNQNVWHSLLPIILIKIVQHPYNISRKLSYLLLKELQRTVTVSTKAVLCEVYCQVQWLSWDPGPRLETFNQWTCCLIDCCRVQCSWYSW